MKTYTITLSFNSDLRLSTDELDDIALTLRESVASSLLDAAEERGGGDCDIDEHDIDYDVSTRKYVPPQPKPEPTPAEMAVRVAEVEKHIAETREAGEPSALQRCLLEAKRKAEEEK